MEGFGGEFDQLLLSLLQDARFRTTIVLAEDPIKYVRPTLQTAAGKGELILHEGTTSEQFMQDIEHVVSSGVFSKQTAEWDGALKAHGRKCCSMVRDLVHHIRTITETHDYMSSKVYRAQEQDFQHSIFQIVCSDTEAAIVFLPSDPGFSSGKTEGQGVSTSDKAMVQAIERIAYTVIHKLDPPITVPPPAATLQVVRTG